MNFIKQMLNNSIHLGVSIIILFLFSQAEVLAEVYSYVDDVGKTHFVGTLTAVPEKFRSAAKTIDSTKFSKVPGGTYPESGNFNPPTRTAAKKPIEIYVTDWCPHCQNLERYLKANNVIYVRHNIERSSKARQEYQALGGGGIPKIKVGSQILQGFDPSELSRVLNIDPGNT